VAREAGAQAAVVSDHFARGGAGAEELAAAVWEVVQDGAPGFRFLSREDASLAQRIERIATRVYGADGVDLSGEARKQLREFERLGHGHMPVCMAKTALSLSHDPALKGRPTGFRVPVRDARLFAGAGFVTAYCGEMVMMPGLPSHPSGELVDINEDGETVGLF
jgi:formate--tetrahydrofolate ligase